MTTRLEATVRVRREGFALAASLQLGAGVTALQGPSGAGKSTLLLALAGLVEGVEGRIQMDGQVWHDSTARRSLPPHQRPVGVVFQRSALFPHLRVLDNVMYGISDLPAARRRERASAELSAVGAEHLAGRWPASLSGGEAQRVAIARAMARPVPLLLLDEPLGALDEEARLTLSLRCVERVRAEGRCALWITHDAAEARLLGASLRMRDGELREA